MNPSKRMRVALVATFGSLWWATGCSRAAPPVSHLQDTQLGYDLRPIEADALASHDAMRHRVLQMPIGEVAARLGAFRLDSEDDVRISDGPQVLLHERVHTSLAWDGNNNVHVTAAGDERAVELYSIGEKAYVRLDRGSVRHKARREVEVQEIVTAATSGLVGVLSAIGGAEFGPAQSDQKGGVDVWTYKLAHKAKDLGQAPLANRPRPPGSVPLPLPAEWTEHATGRSLTGSLTVDSATGAVLRADVSGQLSIAPKGRMLTVALGHRHAIHHVGQVSPLSEPPGSVSEFLRPKRPHEPLAFFKEHLLAGEDGKLTGIPLPVEAPAPSPQSARPPRARRRR